jgi:hypothetical protein
VNKIKLVHIRQSVGSGKSNAQRQRRGKRPLPDPALIKTLAFHIFSGKKGSFAPFYDDLAMVNIFNDPRMVKAGADLGFIKNKRIYLARFTRGSRAMGYFYGNKVILKGLFIDAANAALADFVVQADSCNKASMRCSYRNYRHINITSG